jgi:hypothetical protein
MESELVFDEPTKVVSPLKTITKDLDFKTKCS